MQKQEIKHISVYVLLQEGVGQERFLHCGPVKGKFHMDFHADS